LLNSCLKHYTPHSMLPLPPLAWSGVNRVFEARIEKMLVRGLSERLQVGLFFLCSLQLPGIRGRESLENQFLPPPLIIILRGVPV
jgi:hypothetical protein